MNGRPRKRRHDPDAKANLGGRASTPAGHEPDQDPGERGTGAAQLFAAIADGPSGGVELDAELLADVSHQPRIYQKKQGNFVFTLVIAMVANGKIVALRRAAQQMLKYNQRVLKRLIGVGRMLGVPFGLAPILYGPPHSRMHNSDWHCVWWPSFNYFCTDTYISNQLNEYSFVCMFFYVCVCVSPSNRIYFCKTPSAI